LRLGVDARPQEEYIYNSHGRKRLQHEKADFIQMNILPETRDSSRGEKARVHAGSVVSAKPLDRGVGSGQGRRFARGERKR
jgi:hypothetical protein